MLGLWVLIIKTVLDEDKFKEMEQTGLRGHSLVHGECVAEVYDPYEGQLRVISMPRVAEISGNLKSAQGRGE